MTTPPMPENFVHLHSDEEFIRSQSLKAIAQSADMSLHIQVIETAANLTYHLLHRDEHKDDDDLTVRLLGIRMFNGLNATLKLLLSGYYQASTLHQRDLMETFFLLDYFSGDRALIAKWRSADDAILKREFSPIAVRMALDDRAGHTEKKRAEVYKMFSTLAGHPHPKGFVMYRLPDGKHHCGPFFEEKSLDATLSELAKSAVQVGETFEKFFDHESKVDFSTKLAFLESVQAWLIRYFGTGPLHEALIDDMRKWIAQLP